MPSWRIRSGLIQADRSTVIVEAGDKVEAIRIFKEWARRNPGKVDNSGLCGDWIEPSKIETPVDYQPGD